MIKMMRRTMFDVGKDERFRFIVFEGFDQTPFNNMNAVRNAVGPATAGIIVYRTKDVRWRSSFRGTRPKSLTLSAYRPDP